jgi:hypothetical protein
MLRILMLDLGDTLTDGQHVFSHVPEALEALRQFQTSSGEPLAMCLVSDFHMPEPGMPESQLQAIFHVYVQLLDGLGLTRFFEPVDRHITLSTHAGVRKPHRRIFELAVERLRVGASLPECLFITENQEHIMRAQQLGMQTLRYGPSNSPGVDFGDWSEASLLIARLVNPNSDHNLLLALNVRLAVTNGVHVVSIDARLPDGLIEARTKRWSQLSTRSPDPIANLHVEVSMSQRIWLASDGRIRAIDADNSSPKEVEEATHYVRTLEANHQIAHEPGPLPPGTTHQVETDAEGRRILKRKRFSAT